MRRWRGFRTGNVRADDMRQAYNLAGCGALILACTLVVDSRGRLTPRYHLVVTSHKVDD